MPSENIKVAVRLRSFNEREKETHSKCIIEMYDKQTVLKPISPEMTDKSFAFDYSYWSFDGFRTEPSGYLAPEKGSRYCDQRQVFNDLGTDIIKNAFDGYNSSIFAYGQTSSGKSYSIMGRAPNLGLVPQVCEEIFKQTEQRRKQNGENQFEITFSMIEIYNEVIRDLLNLKGLSDRKGLQLHEMPGKGFQILEKDLKPASVVNYASIQNLIQQGNANKSIAETKMNATSSRAHTIVELVFKQTFKNESGNLMQRMSTINIIDLAGSERADKSMTSGDRLKEGISINLSLTSLGNCLTALANQSSNQSIRVPYRESTLTKLLMNALGGNSKTVMLATISPADSNYQETLSTLRYANRAKQIKCNAIINEDPKDKLIRGLQDEINRLKKLIKGGVMDELPLDLPQKDYEKAKKELEENLKKQLEQNEKEMESMKQGYEQKLAEALSRAKENDRTKTNEKARICPHLSNINVDPMLTGSVKHMLEFKSDKRLIIGSSDKANIQMFGLGVNESHASLTLQNGEFFLEPYANSRVLRNGKVYEEKFKLNNFDRLVFGATLYYLFIDPSKFDQEYSDELATKANNFTVEKVQQEIAEQTGLITNNFDYKKPEEIACLNELIDLMPAIEEANQMSIFLDRKMKYEPIILNPIVIGDPHSKAKPVIMVRKFGTSREWLWDSDKFIDRKAAMSELYLDFREDKKLYEQMLKTFDPFIDVDTEPILVGTAVITPRCILHRIPLDETPKIFDYRKTLVGNLSIELIPCDRQGITFEDIRSSIIHNPETDLKQLYFLVRISQIKCIIPKYKKVCAQFKIFGENDYSKTEYVELKANNSSKLNYQRMVSIDSIDLSFIRYYCTYPLFIQIYGYHVTSIDDSAKMSTRDWFDRERKEKFNSVEKIKQEMDKIQGDYEKSRNKLKNLETLLNFAEKSKNKKKIRIEYVRECLLSNNPEVLEKLYELISKTND